MAETLVRDRFQGKATRNLLDVEAATWGATEVTASARLTLIDLRTTGLVRLGVSTEAARKRRRGRGANSARRSTTKPTPMAGSRAPV